MVTRSQLEQDTSLRFKLDSELKKPEYTFVRRSASSRQYLDRLLQHSSGFADCVLGTELVVDPNGYFPERRLAANR